MFAWIATRTGVQLPSPPAFAFGTQRKSEGCHAEAKRRRARFELQLGAPKDYGLAGQLLPDHVAGDVA
jgi:hypothetical protein